jgi:hypothetical protein
MTTKAGTAALQERDMLQLSQGIAPGRVDAIVAQARRADRWFVGRRSSVDRREGFRFRAGMKKHVKEAGMKK